MAQAKYENPLATAQPTQQNRIGYLSIADDGGEAVVRFMVDSVDDFDIVTMHQIESGGKFRKVSCLRASDYEPLENCPLCAAGVKMQQRMFIPVIEYKKDEAGNIVAVPEIWERSRKEADRLNGFLNNYGPLSEFVSKIIRHGKHGDKATTYDIVPNLDKRIYSDAVYPIIRDAFTDFHAIGKLVQERTAEDFQYYLINGELPLRKGDGSAQPAYEDVQPQYAQPVAPAPQQTYQPAPQPQYGTFVPPETAFSGVSQSPQPAYQPQAYVNPDIQQMPPQFVPQATPAPQQAYPQTGFPTDPMNGVEQPNTLQRPKRYY